MGYAKDQQIRQSQQGWYFKDNKYVCADCFDDDVLKSFIEENAREMTCSYCENKSEVTPVAAPMNAVLDFINEGLRSEWRDPISTLGWDSAEGGWQGEVYDTYDLFEMEFDGAPTSNHKVEKEILDSFRDREWCKPLSRTEGEVLSVGWHKFCELVKHETRYLFFTPRRKNELSWMDEGVDPAEMLSAIGQLVAELDLVRALPAGTRFARARCHDCDVTYNKAAELGPPPIPKTSLSRMSPRGIPMFYGASDENTAIAEVREPRREAVSVGWFETLREILVLDLTEPPESPSIFDRARRANRSTLQFMEEFINDLAKPITNDKEEIEYVPTQIVTEYFRHKFIHNNGNHLDGIVYPSSQGTSGRNCVLFCANEMCCDETHPEGNVEGKLLRLLRARTIVFSSMWRRVLRRILRKFLRARIQGVEKRLST